jgi:L-Ala-D/L-Glu epimerase
MVENPPRLSWEAISLRLANPFRISYGSSDTRQAFWLRLAGDAGWGEGTIPPYYGVDPGTMFDFWAAAALRQDAFPDEPGQIPAWVGPNGPAPARCAVDLALHDRLGRRLGLPLCELLGLPRPEPKATAFTVAIDEPETMGRLASQAAGYPIIKVKLGSDDDEARLAAIRSARPDVRLLVDANAAWSPHEALHRLERLMAYDLELVEQPVPKDDFAGMGYVQAHVDVPVVADESVRSLADLDRLAEAGVWAINIKLMKVGGLAPALAMARRAQELGLRLMLGCMVETSLGVTAVAHLSAMAEWLDLDAPLLVTNDPFEGLTYDERARIHLPDRPGIGVRLRAADAAS